MAGDIAWLFEQGSLFRNRLRAVHNLGAMRLAREFWFRIFGRLFVKCPQCASFKSFKGIRRLRVTASLECSLKHLKQLSNESSLPVECILHGPVSVWYSNIVFQPWWRLNRIRRIIAGRFVNTWDMRSKMQRGEIRPIEIDQYCRNHLLLARDICVLPYLNAFGHTGVKVFRIEAQYYEDTLAETLVSMYYKYLSILHEYPYLSLPMQESDWDKLAEESPRCFNLGGYHKI